MPAASDDFSRLLTIGRVVSVGAKPLTCDVAKTNSTTAVSMVRMLASRMVMKPRVNPELTAERTVLP